MKTVSFVNMKGGVGKTTLAVNMADFLFRRNHKKILVIDVDPQFNATQCLMNGKEYVGYLKSDGKTIVDIFSQSRVVASVADGSSQHEEIPFSLIKPYKTQRGFDLIPGRIDLFKFEMTPGQGTENRLKNYLNYIKENADYDFCIIDCPPTPSVWMTSALLASDYYLIPSKPDPISMTGLDLLDGIIKERKANYGCDCRCAGLVLTMVERGHRVYSESIEYFSKEKTWKNHLYKNVMLKRTSVVRNQLKGVFIADIEDAELKRQFSGIVLEFLSKVGE